MKWVIGTHQDVLGEWAKSRIRYVETWGEFRAIGLIDETQILAAVIYNDFQLRGCAIHIAATPGRHWLNRDLLHAAFHYPFNQLKLSRLTGYVAAKNLDAQRLDEHLGFKREGLIRQMLPDDDVIIYGMLRDECRYLDHGRKNSSTNGPRSVPNGGSADTSESGQRSLCCGTESHESVHANGLAYLSERRH